jgi:hypothetical protein
MKFYFGRKVSENLNLVQQLTNVFLIFFD